MKSRAYQTTPTPVLDLLPSLLTTKTNRPLIVSSVVAGVDTVTAVTEGIFSFCSFKVKVDTDRWRTREGLPDITGCGTTKDAGSGEDRWPSAFQNSFRVVSVFRG